MINYTKLLRKEIEGNYTREAGDYQVVGQVTYRNDNMTSSTATIKSKESGEPVTNFHTAGYGDAMRITINDVPAALKSAIDVIVNETIAELVATVPTEEDFSE